MFGNRNGFSMEAQQLEKELKSLIALKADKVDLEEVKVIKSNKHETDISWNFIEKIHA
jgi:hypothetical protein